MFKYMIGIDAGGTHSTAIAYDEQGKELGRAESGPGQINNDYNLGIKNITVAINELRNKIDGDCIKILAGIAGLSVVGNAPEVAATISSMVGNIPTRAITDSLLALYNGLEGTNGALVIAGTGSVVNGRQNGSLITVGGYGSLLGDEGSGYAITKAALVTALSKWDQRQPSSLIDLFIKIWNLDNMNDAPAKFYTMTSPQVASYAVEIAKLADSGDAEARDIIQEQAHLLARDILMCLDRYQDPKPMRIALTGSVLSNNAMIRSFMEDEVKEQYPDAVFSVSNGENARGVIYDKSKDYRYFTSSKN